jgi:hydrogenase expression/formation protein HypE
VVGKGSGDQIFITTSGIGVVPPGRNLSIQGATPGDCILVSGPIGDHGVAILSVREGFRFETELRSDTAALNSLTQAMLEVCPSIVCMRDITRGGLGTVLNELARASRVGVRIEQAKIPVRAAVAAACELLGLDPLHVACEGRLIAVVAREHAEALLAAMRSHPLGAGSAMVGEVVDRDPGMVVMTSHLGSGRVITSLFGEQLPRIC